MCKSCGTAAAMHSFNREVLEKEIVDYLLDYSEEE